MTIDWNHVTRYSQLIAIVLFVGVFVLGFYLGTVYQERALQNSIHDLVMEEIKNQGQKQ